MAVIDWITNVLSSETFRGGALLTTAASTIAAVVLVVVKQRPIFHGQKLDARRALDESVDRELKRLAAEVKAEAERHAVCEEELARLRSRDLSKARKIGNLERQVDGLRRQLQAVETSRLMMLSDIPPATMKRFGPSAPPIPVRGKLIGPKEEE